MTLPSFSAKLRLPELFRAGFSRLFLIALLFLGAHESHGQGAPPIERGTVTVSQVDRDQWHEATFKLAFDQVPVVIMGPATFAGGDPLTFLVKDVTKQGFKYQIREWEYLGNGTHVKETFSYLAVKPGRHAVGSQLWEAGTRDFPTPGFKLIQTQSPFALPPIVLAQPIAETSVIPRLKDVTATSFRLSLQTEEARPHTDGTPAKCGWLVVSKGAATASGLKSFAGTTQLDVNHTWKQYALTQPRGARPSLFATIQTYKGPDPATVRYREFTNDSVEFRLQEEASQDPEMGHNKEEVGYLILGDVQPRDILTSGLEIGEVQTGNAWKTVTFQNEHRQPVVIPGMLSFNGPEAAIPRISEVSTTKFKVHAAEWDYLDQAHNQEKIPYLVIEDGVYTVGTGVWEAGRAFIDGKKWTKVNFRSGQFGANPVVMVGQTTLKDAAKVTIRVRNVTASGFEARLFRQEVDKAVQHVAETVHFLAVDNGTGNIGGITDFKTWTRGDANHVWKDITLPIFDDLPYVFGATQTTNGIDPIGVRAKDHGVSSFNLKLQEDQSLDQERHHILETVSGIAIGSFSILDSDGDGLTNAEEAYGHEVIYQVEVEVPVLDPVTGEETGETQTITQTHMDWVYTDPTNPDSDGDGLPDKFEIDYGLNPIYFFDGARDSDGDGISDGDEYIAGTHDLSWFSAGEDPLGGDPGDGSNGDDSGGGGNDGDSGSDDAGGNADSDESVELVRPYVDPQRAWLLRFGLDPDDATILTLDTDGDGFTNGEERDRGLNPLMTDSDLDGYSDFQEVSDGTNPLDGSEYLSDLTVAEDGDRDGMLDSWELQHGLDPTDERDAAEDFDYDRLPNVLEYRMDTSPVAEWDELEFELRGMEILYQWSPNSAVSTLTDLGEWYFIEAGSDGNFDLGKWSSSEGYHIVTGFGPIPQGSFLRLNEIAANNFGTVAAWISSIDGYELRVLNSDGTFSNVFTVSDNVFSGGEHSLEVSDSGFVAGSIRYENGDYAAFRWRDGILQVSPQYISLKVRGVSEKGDVLAKSGGVVLPSGPSDSNFNNVYRDISRYGNIYARMALPNSLGNYGYWESNFDRTRRFSLTTKGDLFSRLNISGDSDLWDLYVYPGRFEEFSIDGGIWLLDGRGGFDFDRDDLSQLNGFVDGAYADVESWRLNLIGDDWDGSFTGTFGSPYSFPEEDAAVAASDSNRHRGVVGVITYDADGYYQSLNGDGYGRM